MKRLTVVIYEGRARTPVLSHTAYGRTYAEAAAIVRVHAKYDSFLRAALTTRRFRGIPLRVVARRG
jgi:hypothetical protein